ncbi:piggyBac transposable element-derived protein 4-like isoform X4 [Eriocheir sinensis]|uniref:piggyBac transposable element-derived protein 4-like isoform X4 n=1 Tax=Eriocheir sinensis TaxID=95602 RepID=UPI0021C8FDDD|nr:piggyBac transposable element-derived protein 4-like isoform X4 [Eriocheir sinensis]XP_050722483.1 piggyBac transposable element-derived protein 4-like isoform X4 [Eriocheir sinensis]
MMSTNQTVTRHRSQSGHIHFCIQTHQHLYGDWSNYGNWWDLDIKEDAIEIKEEALNVKEEPLETEESEMTARRGVKRSLSHFCPPEAAQGAKIESLEVKNEPQYYETMVSTDWRTNLTASLPHTRLQPPQHHTTLDGVTAPVPSPPVDPLPSISGNPPTIRLRPRQTIPPGKYFNILFPADGDGDDDSESDLDTDSRDCGWTGENSVESSSRSNVEEPLPTAEDSELFEDEYVEERQDPLSDPLGFPFLWHEASDFVPHLHEFQSDRSGITKDWPCSNKARESDFLRAFLDNEVMSFIAEKSNQYYRRVSQHMDFISPKSRMKHWVDTTPRELMVFLALILVMPLCKKHVLQHYWRNDPIINTLLFRKYMTRDRFLLLLSFLFFANMENYSRNDRIWQVREIFPMFLSRYKKYFYPYQKMVVDESLHLYKERLIFKQSIPSKRCRFDIKLFVLCDCVTGIVVDMIVYTGTDVNIPNVSKNDPLGLSGAIIKKIMAPYMGKGHILYTDICYTSPVLCQFLHDNNTGSCGTVQTNRAFMPKFRGQKTRIDDPSSDDTDQENNGETQQDRCRKRCKKSNLFVQREKSGNVLAIKWYDRHPLHLLSTIHQGDIVNSGKDKRTKKAVMKPDVVIDYTKNIRLVDKSDCQISSVECLRKSTLWHQKFFFHMIDITMLNAYNFWLVRHAMDPTKKLKLREFVYKVVYQLLEDFGQPTSNIKGPRHAPQPDRVVEGFDRHKPVYTDVVDGQRERLDCYVCKNTMRRPQKCSLVTIKCSGCNVGLCPVDCFSDYHRLKNL